MKKALLFTILCTFLVVGTSFSQKLKSDNWEVAIDKWAEKQTGMFGDSQKSYEALITIKKGKTKMKSHKIFYAPKKGQLVLTVKDLGNKPCILPMSFSTHLHFHYFP